MWIYILVFIAYLLGSIPFGLLFTKIAGLGDIRDIGSGNIGTTNVLRTGNKILAGLTLFFDLFKGLMAVSLASMSSDPMITLFAGFVAVVGHMYPVWLKFKGGKGVATGLGVMFGFVPSLGFLMLVIWIGMSWAFRLSSLAALTAFATAPLLAFFLFDMPTVALCACAIGILVFWRHRENIVRILRKEETQITF